MKAIISKVVFVVLMLNLSSCDVLPGLVGGMDGADGISSIEASQGIKQALGQGLEMSIQNLSAKDGFFGNSLVKILLPPEAQKVERTLRSVGLGSVCDDLILSLNRAAESAVKEASPVFVSALSQLTVTDAFNILLSGQQDAATNFFRRTTSEQLGSRFSPIVEKAIGEHQVARYWSSLVTTYNQLPLVNDRIEADLPKYVTDKAIDGLFSRIAIEEANIRNNLAGSRSTPLLQKVFDYADNQR